MYSILFVDLYYILLYITYNNKYINNYNGNNIISYLTINAINTLFELKN